MLIIDSHTHHFEQSNAIINYTPSEIDFKPYFLYSAGLHPWWIENPSESLISSIFNIAIKSGNVVAIGECGIDKLIDIPLNIQIEILEKHIVLSETLKKPLILHCVRAWQELISMHRKYKAKQPWIIHGFRGKPSILHSLLSEGFYISYGSLYNEKSLQATSYDRLLIETDDSPLEIEEVASKVANSLNISMEQLVALTNYNATNIFNFSVKE